MTEQYSMEILEKIQFDPTQIVKIAVGDLTAPVATATELSKLAMIEKSILVDMLQHVTRDEKTNKLILHPETLPWARELRMLYKDINEMTKGVQEKAMMKGLDIVQDIYKQALKNMDSKDVIQIIRTLNDSQSTESTD